MTVGKRAIVWNLGSGVFYGSFEEGYCIEVVKGRGLVYISWEEGYCMEIGKRAIVWKWGIGLLYGSWKQGYCMNVEKVSGLTPHCISKFEYPPPYQQKSG